MFKKKKTQLFTAYDIIIQAIYDNITYAAHKIEEKVERVLTCKVAVGVYLDDSADHDKACEDLQKAKYSLHCAIGEYDALVRDYNEAIKQNRPRNTTLSLPHTMKTSHKLVELFCKEFYQKG